MRREGAMEPRAFLSGLDFYVHYPHEDRIEEFGRAPIEAMAAGVPVILPPAFQETFGAAVLYAEPEAVWDTIQDLWRDEQAYLARARGGRDFVLQHCGYDQLVKRLENLSEKKRRNLAAIVG
jgi:glycosyltransferase involved in cell wall biosynthesis